jgi:mRNA interferase MazF
VADPARGEIWLADLDPIRGHEQGGRRPTLIVSADPFNQGLAGLVIILPLTSRAKGLASHVQVMPPEGGLSVTSYIKCEDVRSVSKDRLMRRWGAISGPTLAAVEQRLRLLLGL